MRKKEIKDYVDMSMVVDIEWGYKKRLTISVLEREFFKSVT